MATINPKSGGINNNIGSILNGGTPVKTTFNALSVATNATTHESPKGVQSATANIGTDVPYSGADYSFAYQQTKDEWIGKVVGTTIGGQTDNTLRSGASNKGDTTPKELAQYDRLDITSWDYQSGAATVGAGAGDAVIASGIDNRTGAGTDDANRGRGEFVNSGPGVIPTQNSY